MYMCDLKWYTYKAQLNTWKTHHALNINTKDNFVQEHNISSTKHTMTLRERQFAGNGLACECVEEHYMT